MELKLTEPFIKKASHLNRQEQESLFKVILALPKAVKNWHEHKGIGLRKIHSTGIFEARTGLDLRIIFGYSNNTLILHQVGNHDEIKKYLRGL